MDLAVPDDLLPYLENYFDVYRPELLGPKTSDRLWISTRRKAMSAQGVYERICYVTKEIIGHPIPPHMFRDCLFTTIAELAPEHIHIGSRLLGHSSPRTGEAHYNQAQGLAAQRE